MAVDPQQPQAVDSDVRVRRKACRGAACRAQQADTQRLSRREAAPQIAAASAWLTRRRGVLRQARRGAAFRAQPAEGQAQQYGRLQRLSRCCAASRTSDRRAARTGIDGPCGWLQLDRPLPRQRIADTVSAATKTSAPSKKEAAEMSSSDRKDEAADEAAAAHRCNDEGKKNGDDRHSCFFGPVASPQRFVTAVLRRGEKLGPARASN